MEDCARQAAQILAVYLDRGRAALAALADGRVDEASEILKKRTAAFHNFRVVDSMALQRGEDLGKKEWCQALWTDIRAVDTQLAEALRQAHQHTVELAQRLRGARRKISSFRSGQPERPMFEQTA